MVFNILRDFPCYLNYPLRCLIINSIIINYFLEIFIMALQGYIKSHGNPVRCYILIINIRISILREGEIFQLTLYISF
jgi:hypothetical protein